MIVTCASCLTKFKLDDSKIPSKGAKVRCSRCRHVFFVVPEAKEKVFEDFKKEHHEDRAPIQEDKAGPPPEFEEKERRGGPPSDREAVFAEPPRTAVEGLEQEIAILDEEEKETVEPSPPIKVVRTGRRGPSMVLGLVMILLLILFAIFYLSSELGSGGGLFPYLEQPVKKIGRLWHQIWGTETEGLVVGDFSRFEESIGGALVSVIEGKVDNQSGFPKKHVRLKVVIYDGKKNRIAEREAICGRLLSHSELRNLPPDFFKGDMVLKPQTQGEMVLPAGKSAPFAAVFRQLPSDAKEFNVEIIEAPNL